MPPGREETFLAVKTLEGERRKRIGINARLSRFALIATAVALPTMVLVELSFAPGGWKNSLANAGLLPTSTMVIVTVIAFTLPFITSFLVPALLGAGRIRAMRSGVNLGEGTVDGKSELVESRMSELGLKVSRESEEGAILMTGTSGARLDNSTPGRNRAREISVTLYLKADAIMADASFRYLRGSAIGVDTGEGEYAGEALRFVLKGGDVPTNPFLKGWAWNTFSSAMFLPLALVLLRVEILPPDYGTHSVIVLGCLTLAHQLHWIYCGIQERCWGKPYVPCALALIGATVAMTARMIAS